MENYNFSKTDPKPAEQRRPSATAALLSKKEIARLASIIQIGHATGCTPFTWDSSSNSMMVSRNKMEIFFYVLSNLLYLIHLGNVWVCLGIRIWNYDYDGIESDIAFHLVYWSALVCWAAYNLLYVTNMKLFVTFINTIVRFNDKFPVSRRVSERARKRIRVLHIFILYYWMLHVSTFTAAFLYQSDNYRYMYRYVAHVPGTRGYVILSAFALLEAQVLNIAIYHLFFSWVLLIILPSYAMISWFKALEAQARLSWGKVSLRKVLIITRSYDTLRILVQNFNLCNVWILPIFAVFSLACHTLSIFVAVKSNNAMEVAIRFGMVYWSFVWVAAEVLIYSGLGKVWDCGRDVVAGMKKLPLQTGNAKLLQIRLIRACKPTGVRCGVVVLKKYAPLVILILISNIAVDLLIMS